MLEYLLILLSRENMWWKWPHPYFSFIFPLFFQSFFMFKAFALLSCDMACDPTLTIGHSCHLYYPPVRQPVSLLTKPCPFMISLVWRLLGLLWHTLKLLSLCRVMTSCLTHSAHSMCLTCISHYMISHDHTLWHLPPFFSSGVTFHSAPSYAVAQFCHSSSFICHCSYSAQIPLFVMYGTCFMTCMISKL